MKTSPAILLVGMTLLAFCGGATASSVAVTADFSHPTGMTAGPYSYSLNAQDAFDPSIAGTPGDPFYKANVASMAAGMLRYSHADEMADSSAVQQFGDLTFSRGWVKDAALPDCDWDETKIQNALNGSYTYGPERMIDIVNWPVCMADSTGSLDPTKYAAYASFCAELVHILNIDLKLHIRYFEVFNELDDNGGLYRGRMGIAAGIYNQAAAAMKAVDPTIKVGGPAFRQAYPTQDFDDFFAGAAANLDFVTFHAYAYCRAHKQAKTLAYLYDQAAAIGAKSAPWVENDFAGHSSGHPEFYLDEFNMNCDGPDERMTDIDGAVFDALTMINAVNVGTSGISAWNEADDRYGKIAGGTPYDRFPSSYLYQAFNDYMMGPVYQSTPGGNDRAIVPFAVKSNTSYLVALVGRGPTARKVRLTLSGIANLSSSTELSVMQVNAGGLQTLPDVTYGVFSSSTGYSLPLNTITIVSLPVSGH